MAASLNPAYLGRRDDLIAMVDGDFLDVIDIGCAQGALGAFLKTQAPGCRVVGVELDPDMARVAAQRLDEVLVGDAVEQLRALKARGARFDLVFLGDILEHLIDPWTALELVRQLCPNGQVLVSLPNVAHYSTILSLVIRQHWPYRERGIHDKTHLRFFSRSNLEPLFTGAGFRMELLRVRYRLIEHPHFINGKITSAVALLPIVGRLLECQYLCRLR